MAKPKSSTDGVAPADREQAARTKQEMEAAGLVPVLVTTALPNGRSGVFFGWADSIDAQSGSERILLSKARNIFFWAENSGGVLALAVEGPRPGSKVGATAPKMVIRHVAAVVHCTSEAALVFGEASWG